jgi:hypothetical protein
MSVALVGGLVAWQYKMRQNLHLRAKTCHLDSFDANEYERSKNEERMPEIVSVSHSRICKRRIVGGERKKSSAMIDMHTGNKFRDKSSKQSVLLVKRDFRPPKPFSVR